jgi:uncharacterized protein
MGQSKPFQKAVMSKAIARCPICKDETEHDYRPFCSKRCADIDLGKWLTGAYAIPVDDNSSDSEDDGSDAAASRTTSATQRRPNDEDD